jgi:hypothetical protein
MAKESQASAIWPNKRLLVTCIFLAESIILGATVFLSVHCLAKNQVRFFQLEKRTVKLL